MSPAPLYDIYCRVVDNYGDIGVCWRLARQLLAEGLAREVRLHVDDLATFARIAPGLHEAAEVQLLRGVTILRWRDIAPPTPPEVVIEAFACDPPTACIAAMRPDTLWLNLEYLSAEDWVEGCHALPSLRPDGQRKFFFFPGFTRRTGGLLRENGLAQARGAWQANASARDALLSRIGVPALARAFLQRGARLVFLFCYRHAPVSALLDGLAASGPTLLLAPQGLHPALRLPTADTLRVCEIPYVDQDDFDRLLWSADLNFVRGEDSLVRALWAARPMVWQPYPQEDDGQLEKLSAWLDRSPWQAPVHALHLAWNGGAPASILPDRLADAMAGPAWTQWTTDSLRWSTALATQPDLAHQLAAFIARQRRAPAKNTSDQHSDASQTR